MMKTKLFTGAVALWLCLSAGAVQANVLSNVAADWGLAANPNGAWSYGYEGTPGGAFTLYDASFTDASVEEWYLSTSPRAGVDRIPLVGKNISGVTFFNDLANGDIFLHPFEGLLTNSVVRWTASAGATITITGDFGAGDNGTVDVYVLHNGLSLFSSLNTFVAEPFALGPLAVLPGDTIDFLVGPDGDFRFDTTPLHATISTPGSVPEPSTCFLLGLGALVLVRSRLERKRGKLTTAPA